MKKSISKQELETLSKTSTVHLLDVRSQQEFEKQHIPAAVNVPADDLPKPRRNFQAAILLYASAIMEGNVHKRARNICTAMGLKTRFILKGEPLVGLMKAIRNMSEDFIL